MSTTKEKIYKVLRSDGASPSATQYTWSLPIKNGRTWTPGKWHNIEGDMQECYNGLHVTTDPRRWLEEYRRTRTSQSKYVVYEVEIKGKKLNGPSTIGQKYCCEKVRLLKLATRLPLSPGQKQYNDIRRRMDLVDITKPSRPLKKWEVITDIYAVLALMQHSPAWSRELYDARTNTLSHNYNYKSHSFAHTPIEKLKGLHMRTLIGGECGPYTAYNQYSDLIKGQLNKCITDYCTYAGMNVYSRDVQSKWDDYFEVWERGYIYVGYNHNTNTPMVAKYNFDAYVEYLKIINMWDDDVTHAVKFEKQKKEMSKNKKILSNLLTPF
jgi:hypothetical protein